MRKDAQIQRNPAVCREVDRPSHARSLGDPPPRAPELPAHCAADRTRPAKAPNLPPHVTPASLVGAWKRQWIRWPDGREDGSTEVHWLQAGHHYADLRMQAGRPSFSGVSSLADCSPEQIRWLAAQEGFAGTLNPTPEGWHWVRELDFQPPAAHRDLGRLRFTDSSASTMIEDGVETPYVEEWARLAPAVEAFALRLEPRGNTRGYLVAAGAMFLIALDRRPPLPPSVSLADLALADVRWLDMEISLGTRGSSLREWTITRSTFPWREGTSPFTDNPAKFDVSSNTLVHDNDRWRLIDPMPQNMTAPPLGLMH